MSEPLGLNLPPEAVERIAERAAELVLERFGSGSPWMDRQAAACYLSLPVSRLEKDRSIPCHRHGRRVVYNRHELDQFLLEA